MYDTYLFNSPYVLKSVYSYLHLREKERQIKTNILNLLVSPTSEGRQIQLNLVAIILNAKKTTMTGNVHLPCSNKPSHFLPQPAFSMSSSASLSFFDLQPQNLMPFLRHDHPLSSEHNHTNKHCCYSQLIYSIT